MNHAAMAATRNLAFAFAPLLLMLGACDAPPPPPPLEGAAIGGPFELVDKTGNTVRWEDFSGKWRMVYFGYTFCPDVCPFDVQKMMRGYDQFAQSEPELADNIQPIFITIDPERDTQDKVGEYTANFSPRLLGLTGSAKQVQVAATAFSAFYAKGEVNAEGGYLMDHSRAGYLMDPAGKPIALLPVEDSAEAVAAELTKWVR